MPITTIISDLGGVLLLRDPAWKEDLEWEAQLELKRGALFQALFQPQRDTAALLGEISEQEIFRLASVALGLEPDQLSGFKQAFWAQYQLNKELATFFTHLRPLIHIAFLSNAWSGARGAFNHLCRLDTLADLQIFSYEEGRLKPDERLYLLALERLSIKAEDALFIDDRLENIQAAQKLGIHTHLFRENNQTILAIQRILNL